MTTTQIMVSEKDSAKFNENMESRRIVQGWDQKDGGIYLKSEQRFSGRGIQQYWDAIDTIIQDIDTKDDSKDSNDQRNFKGMFRGRSVTQGNFPNSRYKIDRRPRPAQWQ